jgi:hypothetical protein
MIIESEKKVDNNHGTKEKGQVVTKRNSLKEIQAKLKKKNKKKK